MGWLAGESTENCSIISWFLCHDDMSGKSFTNVLSRGGVWRVAGVVSVWDLSDDRIPCGLMDVFDVFFISSASCFAGSSPELICSTLSAPKICLSWFDRLSVNTFPNIPLLDTSFSVTMCWGSSSLVAIVNNVVYATPVALSLNLIVWGIIVIISCCNGCWLAASGVLLVFSGVDSRWVFLLWYFWVSWLMIGAVMFGLGTSAMISVGI